jgi:hypothetical protein
MAKFEEETITLILGILACSTPACYKVVTCPADQATERTPMDHDEIPHDSSRDTYMAIVISCVIGVPLFIFFNVITFWMFLDVLIGFLVIGGFCGVNYVLWGRAMMREKARLKEEQEFHDDVEAEQFEIRHLDDRITRRMPN